MSTAARVVPTALSAVPAAEQPLPDGATAALHVDQLGRLVVNLSSVVGVTLATPSTPGVIPVEVTQPAWLKSGPLPLDANGALGLVSGAVRLQRLVVTVYSGNGYLQIHNKVAVPPLTANRAMSPIPFNTASAASPSIIDIGFDDIGGLDCSLGLVVAISSTGSTYTALVGATADVTAWFI